LLSRGAIMSTTPLAAFTHVTQDHRERRDPQSAAAKTFGHGFLPRRASGRVYSVKASRPR
jgi:hypothetical protein